MYKSTKSGKTAKNSAKSKQHSDSTRKDEAYWKWTKFPKVDIDYSDPKVKVFGGKFGGREYGIRLECSKSSQ